MANFNIIGKTISHYLKENGFSKHGNVYCRFVDGDIAQVIELQNGCIEKGVAGILWVNLGIRVPECVEHKFSDLSEIKKYYHDYDCNIRCRLSELCHSDTDGFDLKGDPEKTAADIVEKLKEYAIPVFDKLNSRDNILLYRRDYPDFDTMNDHLLFLEESMIYGKKCNSEKALELFNAYYSSAVKRANAETKHVSGSAHVEYLENLASEIGITIRN